MDDAMHNTLRCMKRDWQLYLFLLVPVAYILIFAYYPMLGIQIAFKDYSVAGGIWGSEWVGLEHFIKFVDSYQFERVIVNTLRLSIYSVLCGFPFPILFALLINTIEGARYKKVAQTIVNLPHFISVVVLVSMVNQVFSSRTGLYGIIGRTFMGDYPPDLFASAANFQHFYLWSGVWQNFGWNSIIYVAALTNVSPELHEAAQIDGASRLQRVIHIDFPAILPTVTIMLILRMGQIMSIGFEKIFLMQNSLNLSMSEVISTYVYKVGLTGRTDFSYSTAINLFNSIINMVLIVTVNWISGKVSETSLW
ncbi:MAG TPA: sugar ABC transporter permease [Candidatus Ornithocaccomicrobium faecavium]|uniref:Sugar ABC transporter permease n=1 Tax=Candidatus Ornithocaccomicrobium faecavium TaxID=2840890 RepID=A0A9D1P9W1_9FIRM|nr:sugar ABC transporter permease [Candidatus Ornithocaccomicrobium faecavium]